MDAAINGSLPALGVDVGTSLRGYDDDAVLCLSTSDPGMVDSIHGANDGCNLGLRHCDGVWMELIGWNSSDLTHEQEGQEVTCDSFSSPTTDKYYLKF